MRWQKFQQLSAIASNPFFSLTYAKAVARSAPAARVAVVEEGGEIEAFIPYELSDHRVGTTIGGMYTCVDGLVSSNAPINLRSAVKDANLRGWRFLYSPVEQTALAPYRNHLDYQGTSVSTIELPSGFAGYLGGMTKSARKAHGRVVRSRPELEKAAGPVSFEWNSSKPADLDCLLRWKAAQYGNVADWLVLPGKSHFVHELAESDAEDCAGVLSVLRAGDRMVAGRLGLRAGATLALWITAYDPEFAQFQSGMMSLFMVVEEAPGREVERIDFGYGDNFHKRRFANSHYEIGGGEVWASGLEAGARRVYQRLRYRRVLPPAAQPAATNTAPR
jgi:CelD/BcsL family acetyltransferase involved in cellulose biosynthesis